MMNFDDSFCSKREAFKLASNKVWEALSFKSVSDLAGALNVDERTIRRWRDKEVLPSLHLYVALCRLVESEGGSDSPFDILYRYFLLIHLFI